MKTGTLRNLGETLNGARVKVVGAGEDELMRVELLEERKCYKVGDLVDIEQYNFTADA